MMAGVSLAIKFSPSPKPDHHAARVADARGHDLVWLIGRHQHHHIRALDLIERLAGGFHQTNARCQIMLHQMHDGFSVRFRLKFHALCDQFILEFQEVFDDAVLHDHDPLRLAEMRMRVARVRARHALPSACDRFPGRR